MQCLEHKIYQMFSYRTLPNSAWNCNRIVPKTVPKKAYSTYNTSELQNDALLYTSHHHQIQYSQTISTNQITYLVIQKLSPTLGLTPAENPYQQFLFKLDNDWASNYFSSWLPLFASRHHLQARHAYHLAFSAEMKSILLHFN